MVGVRAVVLTVSVGLGSVQSGWGEKVDVDWRATTHGNLVSAVRNFRGLPGKACNAGWAFAATAMVGDRIAVLDPMAPKVQLSNQVLLNCATDFDGCSSDEASIEHALQYILESGGIPDRTCMGWRAEKEECKIENMCVNCLPEGCQVRPQYMRYSISSYGRVDVGNKAALIEELQNGPLACQGLSSEFFSLVAFDQAKDHFVAKFERGTFYKDHGFGTVRTHDLKECWFAKVRLPWRHFAKNETAAAAAAAQSNKKTAVLSNSGMPKKRFEGHLPSKRQNMMRMQFGSPETDLFYTIELGAANQRRVLADLPKNFSWIGKNTITPTQSHHNGPGYCGACWALASASAFSDRLKIMSGGKNAPDVYMSPQTTIDCVKPDGCGGGGAEEAYTLYQQHGTVDETCNAWLTGQVECMNHGQGCRSCDADGVCQMADASTHKVYRAASWGNIKPRSELEMMRALQDGPIVCGVSTDPGMDELFWGDDILCDDHSPSEWEISHDIEVVGYGETAAGEKYWEIRNSWSTAYGQNGFAKICRGKNNILIEESCTWVKPAL